MKSMLFDHHFSLVAQSCPTLCDPMDCSMPGFDVHHQLLELAQTHIHLIGDAIQISHPLSFASPAPSIFSSIRVFSNGSVLHISGQIVGASASTSEADAYDELSWTHFL